MAKRPDRYSGVRPDPDAVNEWNKQGITLAAVDEALVEAVGHQLLLKGRLPALQKSRETWLKRQMRRSPHRLWRAPRDNNLVRDGDWHLADQIVTDPLTCIDSPQHFAALGRWIYAYRNARSKEVRTAADRLLDVAMTRPRAKPKAIKVRSWELQQIHADLRVYISSLLYCASEIHDSVLRREQAAADNNRADDAKVSKASSSQISKAFPDASALLGRTGITFEDLWLHGGSKMRPGTLADEFLGKRFGLSGGAMQDLRLGHSSRSRTGG